MFIHPEFEQSEERYAECENTKSSKSEGIFDKDFLGFEPFKGLQEPSYRKNLRVS